jgi:hypothetical protein
MNSAFGMVYPLWDYVADEGRLLERVVGDAGINHVTVPVVSGAQTEFRLSCSGETPHFHTGGGWHYRASTKAYSAAALNPSKARWFAGGDLLAQMRERASGAGLNLILRVDVRAVRSLVDHELHLCQRNAWGQEVPFAGGCALNPELRELLRCTLNDLRRYEPAGLEIVDWVPDCAVDRAANRPLSWHPSARRLLDVCFCASCRQVAERAGLEPEHAASAVREQVEKCLADPANHASNPPGDVVEAYINVRNADCCQWLRRVAESDPERRHLLVRTFGDPSIGNIAPWVRMVRLPNRACGSLDGPEWATRIEALPQIAALTLPVWKPTFAEAAEFVRFISEAVKAGVSTFDFEGLNEAADDAVTWLKQATRFARRG